MRFSEEYGRLRMFRAELARETPERISEEVIQCVWYDQLFSDKGLSTDDGRSLRVVSPGWWNHGEGPDFRGAQIEFNGRLRTGDVEIHLRHGGWRQHGHHMDSRYDDVMLHVVLETESPSKVPLTSAGKPIVSLLLPQYLEEPIQHIADTLEVDDYPNRVEGTYGRCAGVAEGNGPGEIAQLLRLAGEWRMLFKARTLRERMEQIGEDQAVYEAFLYACGFSHFKHHFKVIARQLPYDRAAQLAREDPLLLEAALLQLSGLMPASLPQGTKAVPHYGRLRGLRNARLDGLRPMPLEWKRIGVRPANYPERRMAGAARFIAGTAPKGFVVALDEVWALDAAPLARRKAFEKLFPSSTMGFWGAHCTWTGKTMSRPSAPIGAGRIRSIIGNVFIPAGLAMARSCRDRIREERILEFFAALPSEPENKVQRAMLPRVFGTATPPRLNFRMQQGLLQTYFDWCEPNPSCRNCRVMGYFAEKDAACEKPGRTA